MLMLIVAAFLQSAAPPPRILIKTIDKGAQSMVDSPRQVTIRTPEEMTKLWKGHAPDRVQPTIDFSRDMVIGIFLGSRPSAGYDVAIVGAREDQGKLLVRYQLTTPSRDAVAAQIITMPYHLAVVPKYAGEVKFEQMK